MDSSPLPIDAIRQAARDPAIEASLNGLFRRLDERVASKNPQCILRGSCCKFGEYDHRLFVTTLELAYFFRAEGGSIRAPGADTCPYQVEGRCTVRGHRPAGCRIFFCDPGAQAWQSEESEQTLSELRARHEELGVEYVYIDWIEALRQLADGGEPHGALAERTCRGLSEQPPLPGGG